MIEGTARVIFSIKELFLTVISGHFSKVRDLFLLTIISFPENKMHLPH